MAFISKDILAFRIILIFIFFNSINLSIFFAQDISQDVLPIDSIIIIGNKVTKKEIILRELDFKEGDLIKYKDINYYRERIYSLELFNNVIIEVEKKESKNVLMIILEESWYYLFLPYAILRKNSLSKSSFGLYLNKKNFRGLNEKLKLVFALGYDPYLQFQYFSPNFIGKDLFANADFSLSSKENKSDNLIDSLSGKNFSYQSAGFSLSVGYRVSLYAKFSMGLGYENLIAPEYAAKYFFLEKKKNEIKYYTFLNAIYDDRDLNFMPEIGKYIDFKTLINNINLGKNFFYNFVIDIRNYHKLFGDFTAKERIYYESTTGNYIPYYAKKYLGYDQKVRGHYFDNKEGDKLFLFSAEAKYPIIKEWNIKFSLPVVPEALTSYRTALYIYAFADAGSIVSKNEKFAYNNFDKGYGAGLAFLIMPYQALRCELAFNEKNRREIIVELGFSF